MDDVRKPELIWPLLAVLAILAVFLMGIIPARTTPPGNDEISSVTNVFRLAYRDTVDISNTKEAADDNLPSCSNSIRGSTVWHQYTPMPDTLITASSAQKAIECPENDLYTLVNEPFLK